MTDILISEDIAGAEIDELAAEFRLVRQPDLWRAPAEFKKALGSCRALIVRNQTQVNADRPPRFIAIFAAWSTGPSAWRRSP